MSQLALARHYRPQTFQAVIGQEATLRALKAALETKHLHHAYLFTGTRGVGKTTLARILAKCLNCEQGISSTPCGTCHPCQAIQAGTFVDVVEVDAASRTKVEDIRELLDNVQYLPTYARFKIYLIDEVHMLSTHSFNALLKTLEEPPTHVKFLFATTDPQKMPVTVLSRCLQFHLRRLPFPQIVGQLEAVLRAENLQYEQEALEILGHSAEGSMRDALSLLDQAIAYMYGTDKNHQAKKLFAKDVRQMLGLTEKGRLLALLAVIARGQAQTALQELKLMAEFVPDFSLVLIEWLKLLHQIAIAQQVPEAIEEGISEREAILNFAKELPSEQVQLFYQIALLGQKDLSYAPTARMGFEMVILRMLAFQPVQISETTHLETAEIANPSPLPIENLAEDESDLSSPVLTEQSHSNPSQDNSIQQDAPTKKIIQETIQMSKGEPKLSNLSGGPDPSHSWLEMLPKLNLKGMANELARHCSVLEWSEQKIHLVLEDGKSFLGKERNKEGLQEALCQYLNKPIRLMVTFGDRKHETLAMYQERHQDLAQKKAQELIHTDLNVLKIIDHFDAQIEEITVMEDPV